MDLKSYITEAVSSGKAPKRNAFPDEMPENTNHTDDPEDIWELLLYLDDHGNTFTVEKGRFDDSTDVVIDTNIKGVTTVLSFIGPSEYLLGMEKNGKEIYSLNSSKTLGWGNHFDLDVLDPRKYFTLCLRNMEKRLASAKKGKRNRRTGEIEKNWSDISYYEGKVERYKKYLEKVK